jgi:2',3'-cyclic-nucleotide 2'-phosphodiesterase (5'-nucleotidase family)
MFPFENMVTIFEMTGAEVKKMLFSCQSGTIGSFYQTSGIVQNVVTDSSPKLISFKLFDGTKEFEISEEETYKVAAIDFLIPNGGDDFKEIMNWYSPKNLTKHGNLRENIIEYISKYAKYMKKDYLIDRSHRKINIISNNLRGVNKYFS